MDRIPALWFENVFRTLICEWCVLWWYDNAGLSIHQLELKWRLCATWFSFTPWTMGNLSTCKIIISAVKNSGTRPSLANDLCRRSFCSFVIRFSYHKAFLVHGLLNYRNMPRYSVLYWIGVALSSGKRTYAMFGITVNRVITEHTLCDFIPTIRLFQTLCRPTW